MRESGMPVRCEMPGGSPQLSSYSCPSVSIRGSILPLNLKSEATAGGLRDEARQLLRSTTVSVLVVMAVAIGVVLGIRHYNDSLDTRKLRNLKG